MPERWRTRPCSVTDVHTVFQSVISSPLPLSASAYPGLIMDGALRRIHVLRDQLAPCAHANSASAHSNDIETQECRAAIAPAARVNLHGPPVIIGGMLLDVQVVHSSLLDLSNQRSPIPDLYIASSTPSFPYFQAGAICRQSPLMGLSFSEAARFQAAYSSDLEAWQGTSESAWHVSAGWILWNGECMSACMNAYTFCGL